MEDFNDSIVVEMHGNEEVAFVIRMAVKTIVENEANNKDIIFMKKSNLSHQGVWFLI